MKTKAADIPYCNVNEDRIHNAAPKLNMRNAAIFLEYVIKRYKIHLKKDVHKLPPPWTDDETLCKYRFTNVRREHDKVSMALIKTVSKNRELTLEEKILNTIYFRAWNNPDTFKDLGGPWSAKQIYSPKLKEWVRPWYHEALEADPERKWWSPAYIQGGFKASIRYPEQERNMDPINYRWNSDKDDPGFEETIALRVFHIGPWLKDQEIVRRLLDAKDQYEAFTIIKDIRGFANFLAYQVFVDLTYIKDFPFSENEFTIAGPGCRKGIDLIFKDRGGMTHDECIFWIRDNFDKLAWRVLNRGYTDMVWDPEELFEDLKPHDRCMNVMSLENCFCEISKYIRAVTGTGRPRNKYIIKGEE